MTPERSERDSLLEMAEFPEMNPGPVLRLDLDGIVLRANLAARRAFRDDGLPGACWFDICPGMTRELWAGVLAAAEPTPHEAMVQECCFVFTHAHRPGADQVFVYGSDITARRQAERALAELARFPEMNPGPVCRLDREGVILLANAAARRLFDEEALVGKSWLDVCPGLTASRWQEVLLAAGNTSHEAEVGQQYIMFTHTPGGEEEIFAYGADLTQQRLAERALHQNERMATLGTLAAGVAHELNNPAAAAQRAAEHLRDEFARLQQAQVRLTTLALSEPERTALLELDQGARSQASCACDLDAMARSDREEAIEAWLDARGIADGWELAGSLVELDFGVERLTELEARFPPPHLGPVVTWLSHAYPVYRLLEEIRHGAGRVSEIVGALKAYSYVGQGPLHSVNLNEGLRHTLIILRSKLKRGVTVEQDLAADLPAIQAYGGELNQVWTNLIDNAVDALDGSGKIRLRSRRDGEWVVVEIEDNGPGIPEAIQSRIFDPFFTTKPPGRGTGLGLHTSYDLVVRKHRGLIELESRPGSTRFRVRLPITPPRPDPSPEGSPAS